MQGYGTLSRHAIDTANWNRIVRRVLAGYQLDFLPGALWATDGVRRCI